MTYELHVTFDSDTKNVQVTGPTDDMGLCHLMIDLARQSLFQFKMMQLSEKRVVAPNGFPIPKLPTQ